MIVDWLPIRLIAVIGILLVIVLASIAILMVLGILPIGWMGFTLV